MDHLCFVFVVLSCLFIAALRSSAGKGPASWLSCIVCYLKVFVCFVALRPKSTAMAMMGRSVI